MSSEVKQKPFHYLDSPEGEDVGQKLLFLMKPTILSGIFFGTCDVMLYSRPKGYLATLGRYAFITVPFIGMSTAFVIGSNLIASLRKSDDKVNWAAGGALAGSVFGIWRKSIPAGVAASVVLAGGAALKKHALQNDWSLLAQRTHTTSFGGLNTRHYDFTLLKDPRDATKS